MKHNSNKLRDNYNIKIRIIRTTFPQKINILM